VNGVALNEPYLYRNGPGQIEPTEAFGTTQWLVPAGALFVMGDHRRQSSDSRMFGPIEVSSVIGRGVLRYWPPDRFGPISAATYGER
jgi:signal peptidase I